jgi:hypothetical protein
MGWKEDTNPGGGRIFAAVVSEDGETMCLSEDAKDLLEVPSELLAGSAEDLARLRGVNAPFPGLCAWWPDPASLDWSRARHGERFRRTPDCVFHGSDGELADLLDKMKSGKLGGFLVDHRCGSGKLLERMGSVLGADLRMPGHPGGAGAIVELRPGSRGGVVEVDTGFRATYPGSGRLRLEYLADAVGKTVRRRPRADVGAAAERWAPRVHELFGKTLQDACKEVLGADESARVQARFGTYGKVPRRVWAALGRCMEWEPAACGWNPGAPNYRRLRDRQAAYFRHLARLHALATFPEVPGKWARKASALLRKASKEDASRGFRVVRDGNVLRIWHGKDRLFISLKG